MKKILTQPLFLIGLVIRLGMILLLLPKATNIWYAPFMDITTAQFTLDPWGIYLKHAGASVAAFPYGYVMWLAFLPLTLLCKLAGIAVAYGYGITLVAADLSLLMVLNKMLLDRGHLLLATYWLSPIVLLSTYWLGLNDLIPVLLLSLALYFTKQLRLLLAGLFCAAAISAKFSMVLTIPFFLIYLTHNKALRQLLPDYLKGIVILSFILGLPFVFLTSGLHMLLHNPEMDKIYQLGLNLGNNTLIYVLPLAYLVTLYFAWRVRRLNYDLFNALLGIAFLIVVLLTPASPGWFIWIMPMLVFYQATNGKIAIALTATFSVLYVLNSLLITSVSPFIWMPDKGSFIVIGQLFDSSGAHIVSLLHTAMVAIGIVLTMRIWRETVSSNDYFKLSRKPFAIGIAGDSGAGKDTLAESLRGLFGSHSVAYLSGDDYHLWDRQKPMWQVMTHLNPKANDLESFSNDLIDLVSGKSILSRHYNHQTGKMSSRQFHIKSNDFIIASGLHALYLPILRNCYNLSIFLDINEELRRYYKLQRDVHQRGHSPERVLLSLEKREPDSARFIRPQFVHADLVISLEPIHPHVLKEVTEEKTPRVKLSVISRSGLNELSLTRVLVGVCGLHVDVNINQDTTESSMTIEGETSAEDIALAAKILFPRILEFLDIAPQWKDGILGLMQLITLVHIDQALNRRLI